MATKYSTYANALSGKEAGYNQDDQYNNLNLRGGYTPDYAVHEWQLSTNSGKHNPKKGEVQGLLPSFFIFRQAFLFLNTLN
uniref:Uncharacterized protein n=1 Tax=Panagrolaimus davidi TaxID=227884 RepID=A0A914PBZ9_9BILA